MNKCYYCNNSPRGCPECRATKAQLPATPVWRTLDMGEAGEALKLVKRNPIKNEESLAKGALLDADWATQVLWLKCVQQSLDLIDDSIRLELVREPSNRYPMLISRTNFEFMADRMQRTRVQAWSMSVLYSMNAIAADDPDQTAKFIADWWEVRRQNAYQQETSKVGPAPYWQRRATKAPINIVNRFPSTPLKVDAQLPETWEQLEPNVHPSVTDADDAWDAAVYWGSRAGGKTQRMSEEAQRQYYNSLAQEPLILVHDEVTTYVDAESEYAGKLDS